MVNPFILAHSDEILFTTEINVFELYLGLYSIKTLEKNPSLMKKRLSYLEELLFRFQILPFGRKEAIQAAKILGALINQGKPIEFRAGLIAGIALSNGITTILTKNLDHFSRIEGVKVITY
ncbi:MAG: type II toxin-antitoxin system VapC family toxin [Candidatus Helarchaeota archaeon]|nr:type II toxin-antitoxin system VapC family toxin [Candidatus Helarchaeota archaeon]